MANGNDNNNEFGPGNPEPVGGTGGGAPQGAPDTATPAWAEGLTDIGNVKAVREGFKEYMKEQKKLEKEAKAAAKAAEGASGELAKVAATMKTFEIGTGDLAKRFAAINKTADKKWAREEKIRIKEDKDSEKGVNKLLNVLTNNAKKTENIQRKALKIELDTTMRRMKEEAKIFNQQLAQTMKLKEELKSTPGYRAFAESSHADFGKFLTIPGPPIPAIREEQEKAASRIPPDYRVQLKREKEEAAAVAAAANLVPPTPEEAAKIPPDYKKQLAFQARVVKESAELEKRMAKDREDAAKAAAAIEASRPPRPENAAKIPPDYRAQLKREKEGYITHGAFGREQISRANHKGDKESRPSFIVSSIDKFWKGQMIDLGQTFSRTVRKALLAPIKLPISLATRFFDHWHMGFSNMITGINSFFQIWDRGMRTLRRLVGTLMPESGTTLAMPVQDQLVDLTNTWTSISNLVKKGFVQILQTSNALGYLAAAGKAVFALLEGIGKAFWPKIEPFLKKMGSLKPEEIEKKITDWTTKTLEKIGTGIDKIRGIISRNIEKIGQGITSALNSFIVGWNGIAKTLGPILTGLNTLLKAELIKKGQGVLADNIDAAQRPFNGRNGGEAPGAGGAVINEFANKIAPQLGLDRFLPKVPNKRPDVREVLDAQNKQNRIEIPQIKQLKDFVINDQKKDPNKFFNIFSGIGDMFRGSMQALVGAFAPSLHNGKVGTIGSGVGQTYAAARQQAAPFEKQIAEGIADTVRLLSDIKGTIAAGIKANSKIVM